MDMKDFKLFKYRTKWAWGRSSWSSFLDFSGEQSETIIREWADRIHSENGYSDKYRGVEISEIKTPNKEECEYLWRCVKANIERIVDMESKNKKINAYLKRAKNA